MRWSSIIQCWSMVRALLHCFGAVLCSEALLCSTPPGHTYWTMWLWNAQYKITLNMEIRKVEYGTNFNPSTAGLIDRYLGVGLGCWWAVDFYIKIFEATHCAASHMIAGDIQCSQIFTGLLGILDMIHWFFTRLYQFSQVLDMASWPYFKHWQFYTIPFYIRPYHI